MVPRPNELNKYIQLKTKIKLTKADIFFLQNCKKMKIFPKFIHIKEPFHRDQKLVRKIVHTSKQIWLNYEIKHHFTKLNTMELELLNLHLKLTKNLSPSEHLKWLEFDTKANNVSDHKSNIKFNRIKSKLRSLKKSLPNLEGKSVDRRNPVIIPNFVKNLSKQIFTDDEQQLLNRGLNFALPPKFDNTHELASHIEVALKPLDPVNKQQARFDTRTILKEKIKIPKSHHKFHQTVKTLKDKDCYYMKADKGNSLVILDKSDYIQRMEKLITDGPYDELTSNPLTKMIKEVTEMKKNLIIHFPEEKGLQWKLQVSNPSIPCIYALPKIHKPGDKMRPIVSYIDAPASKISSWLVREFSKLKQPEGFYVENSFELIHHLSSKQITNDEIMVSFDVEALFPNVPIPETLILLADWLESNDIEKNKIDMYVAATKLCMNQSVFVFNNKFYIQNFGTSMGNPLSPFLSNLFMSKLETSLSTQEKIFPKIWFRYVDDVFAVIGKHQLRRVLNLLNSKHKTIKFTYECEEEGKLPFLDLLISKENNTFTYNIYRKPTSTQRFITNDSYHSHQHKAAAFNSMTYRLVNTPLNDVNFKNELQFIKSTATLNGYDNRLIDNLVRKFTKKKKIKELTTLQNLNTISKRRAKIPYTGQKSRNLKSSFKKYDIDLIEVSDLKLGNILGSTKDKKSPLDKSGIYKIQCDECPLYYIGQSRRKISTRFTEHRRAAIQGKRGSSAAADHCINSGHTMSQKGLHLLKTVRDNQTLDFWETIFINKQDENLLLNNEPGPLSSSILTHF